MAAESTVSEATPRAVAATDWNDASERMDVTVDENTERPVATSSPAPCSATTAESGADTTNDTSQTK
jgi:hypothetical protein